MSINTKLLSEICTVPGAPGFEKKIRDLVLLELKGLVDEVQTDNMGNVYAIKKGALPDDQRKKSDGRSAHG
jgi:tetrahedral aminopeptidase